MDDLTQQLEQSWATWLACLFKGYLSHPFAAHHKQFWEWLWAIEAKQRPKPFIGAWARGMAKSSSAEMASVALGARGIRRYGLYICHEKGTEIRDPSLGWMRVEEHPSAKEWIAPALEVRLGGMPMREVVAEEHRYWIRRVARRDHGHDREPEIRYGEPHWEEARYLDWNAWIGMPIDRTIEEVPAFLSMYHYPSKTYRDVRPEWADNPEFWWLVGLWWGDGTLGGARNSAITWCLADVHPDIVDRLCAVLDTMGIRWVNRPCPNDARCHNLTACHAGLARWLHTWKEGKSRKKPPAWVEHLPLHLQEKLLRGYFDADGHVDDRTSALSSIHLPGLLSARRMLARLGIASWTLRAKKERFSNFEGRIYRVAEAYLLQIAEGRQVLGHPAVEARENVRDFWIADDCLWSRVRDVVSVGERILIPIETSTGTYETHFGLSHNCETQEQADDHVGSVAGMLESRAMGRWYPEMADRAVGKFGSSKGWRRNRLRTRAGFTIDALGLDTASRGLKIEEDRPDLMILDDLDSDKDSAAATEKKLRYLQRRILPAGTPDVAVLAIQNIVNSDGIFARFIDGRADFLVDRIVSGPIPAIEDFEYEQREDRTVITSGRATWKGLDLDRCQDQIDTFGITAFLAEAQHVMPDPAGGMFDQLTYRHCSFDDVPPLDMVVCWVDPAVTDTDSSDSMGIQIDGLARDGTIYRLYSWEHRGSPEATIEHALRKAKEYGAAHVGIETDQGGDTWRSVYAQAQLATGIRHIPMRWEKAGAGHGSKVHRASQMLSRYERGGFVHVMGTHDVLERALNRFPKTKPYDLVDACLVPGTMIETEHGPLPIEAVEVGMRVQTRAGLRPVTAAGLTNPSAQISRVEFDNGASLEGTENHPIWTENRGWIPLGKLRYRDIVLVCERPRSTAKSSGSKAIPMSDIPTQRSGITGSITALWERTRSAGTTFIGRFGRQQKAPSRRVWTSITSTTIRSTTTSPTSCSLRVGTIEGNTAVPGLAGKQPWSISPRFALSPSNGIRAKKAELGTGSMASRAGSVSLIERSPVLNVGSPSKPGTTARLSDAQGNAGTRRLVASRSTMRLESARDAASRSEPTSTTGTESAAVTAVVRVLGKPIVVSVGPVYNLTVQDQPEYFANGILVHNCVWSAYDLTRSGPVKMARPAQVMDPLRRKG